MRKRLRQGIENDEVAAIKTIMEEKSVDIDAWIYVSQVLIDIYKVTVCSCCALSKHSS